MSFWAFSFFTLILIFYRYEADLLLVFLFPSFTFQFLPLPLLHSELFNSPISIFHLVNLLAFFWISLLRRRLTFCFSLSIFCPYLYFHFSSSHILNLSTLFFLLFTDPIINHLLIFTDTKETYLLLYSIFHHLEKFCLIHLAIRYFL